MRNALNNLQATFSGFKSVTRENVFKVCDQPHPGTMAQVLDFCMAGSLPQAHTLVRGLWDQGYSAMDIIGTLFKVIRSHPDAAPTPPQRRPTARRANVTHANPTQRRPRYPLTPLPLSQVCKYHEMPEPEKLEYIKEIGFTHMRISEGLNTYLQLVGLLSRLCKRKLAPSA